MRPWWWGEAAAERAKHREVPACAPDDHVWRRYSHGGIHVIVQCHDCGRSPIEAIDAMESASPAERAKDRIGATVAAGAAR